MSRHAASTRVRPPSFSTSFAHWLPKAPPSFLPLTAFRRRLRSEISSPCWITGDYQPFEASQHCSRRKNCGPSISSPQETSRNPLSWSRGKPSDSRLSDRQNDCHSSTRSADCSPLPLGLCDHSAGSLAQLAAFYYLARAVGPS